MAHELILADPAYSSWSLRAWLIVHRFDIPHDLRWTTLYTDTPIAAQIDATPARTVPTMIFDDGAVAFESLAIAEELATRFPDRGLWPANAAQRARARSLAAEMHGGFTALRGTCPMCLRTGYTGVAVPDAVAADLRRVETLWSHALSASGGPWLAGGYSIADAFFAPVAARIAGYGLTVDAAARAYVNRHLTDSAFQAWRDLAAQRGPDLHEAQYLMPYDRVPFPDAI